MVGCASEIATGKKGKIKMEIHLVPSKTCLVATSFGIFVVTNRVAIFFAKTLNFLPKLSMP